MQPRLAKTGTRNSLLMNLVFSAWLIVGACLLGMTTIGAIYRDPVRVDIKIDTDIAPYLNITITKQ